MSSAAESISAWIIVFDCPSMVAAFNFALYLPAIKLAAFSQIRNLKQDQNLFITDFVLQDPTSQK